MSYVTKSTTERGCGFRSPGSLYLCCDGTGMECGLFPIHLGVCPTCSAGYKPSRGWTWIDIHTLIENRKCALPERNCQSCWQTWTHREGLIWIGGMYYRRPDDLLREATRMGISRKISTIPKGFRLGTTWVFMAHREVWFDRTAPDTAPGIFGVFRPTAIEYVLRDEEVAALTRRAAGKRLATREARIAKRIERLQHRGVTAVQDVRMGQLEFPPARTRVRIRRK